MEAAVQREKELYAHRYVFCRYKEQAKREEGRGNTATRRKEGTKPPKKWWLDAYNWISVGVTKGDHSKNKENTTCQERERRHPPKGERPDHHRKKGLTLKVRLEFCVPIGNEEPLCPNIMVNSLLAKRRAREAEPDA